jgi:hypothetical protein
MYPAHGDAANTPQPTPKEAFEQFKNDISNPFAGSSKTYLAITFTRNLSVLANSCREMATGKSLLKTKGDLSTLARAGGGFMAAFRLGNVGMAVSEFRNPRTPPERTKAERTRELVTLSGLAAVNAVSLIRGREPFSKYQLTGMGRVVVAADTVLSGLKLYDVAKTA